MRVLVTAGGTRAPLDEVRWIGNVSTGRFGAEISLECLRRGAEVVHLHARGAEMPFQRTIDFERDWEGQLSAARKDALTLEPLVARYRSIVFTEVGEYAALLEETLRTGDIDVAFLAAAVSDYAPEPVAGKISSQSADVLVRMTAVPKLIARVKDWAPDVYQVGFKLLAGSSEEELIETARRSGLAHRSDLTVANDLRPLRQGRHTVHLVRDGHPTETFGPDEHPAERLVERVLRWAGRSESNAVARQVGA